MAKAGTEPYEGPIEAAAEPCPQPSETPTLDHDLGDQPSTLGAGLARERVRSALFGFTHEVLKIDRFTVLETIGRGGMGVVYAAWDPQLDRRVAVKLVRTGPPHVGGDGRVLDEARAMAKVPHPNVVTVFETGMFGDGEEQAVFVAMEFVRGMTLRAWAEGGSRAWRQTVEVYRDAARGLAAIHRAQLVHGDFKPDNVMIDDDGHVRVMDFGLARPIAELTQDLETTDSDGAAPPPLVGTPAYMAPEQLRGEPPDARSDQFAFFVSLYEALWQERPWTGTSPIDVATKLLEAQRPPRPPAGAVPAWVVDSVMRGLCPAAADRHPSMSAVVDALTETSGARRTWVFPAATLAVLSGLYVWSDAKQPVCAKADDAVDAVWHAESRARLHDALAASGREAAESAARHTLALLDRYAEEQRVMRSEACLAANVDHTESQSLLDLRVMCLDRGHAQFSSLVATLTERPAIDTVESAAVAAATLPKVAACSDVRALTSVVAPPSDPQRRAQLDQLWNRHAQAATLLAAAEFERGIQLTQHMLDEATTLGHAPLLAQVHLLHARLLRRVGHSERALSVLNDAALAAAEGSDDATLATVLSEMAVISSADLQRSREALGLETPIQAALVRSGSSAGHARAAYALGLVHHDAGQLEAAAESLQAAIDLLEGTDDTLALGAALNDLALVRTDQDRLQEALALGTRGLELRQSVVGELHPLIADSHNNLAVVHRRSGDRQQGQRELHEALAIYDATIGRNTPRAADTLMNLGIAVRHDDAALARRWLEEALAIFEQSTNPLNPSVSAVCTNLSAVLTSQGDLKGAIEYLERARAIQVELHGEDHRTVGVIDANLAGHLAWQGRSEAAVERYERARTVLRRALGWEHPTVVRLHVPLASAYVDIGRFQDAVDTAAFALAEHERDPRTTPFQLADAQFAMARALWEQDPTQRREALTLAEQARDALLSGNAADVEQAGRVAAWIAEHRD